MRVQCLQAVLVVALAGRALPGIAAGAEGDSLYASPDLRASTSAPWNPVTPVHAARSWESVLRAPGRIASLPLVALGRMGERSAIHLENSGVRDRALHLAERSDELGIVALPASLGDHSGLGAEVGWAPRALGYRLRGDLNVTTLHYNRERLLGVLGPLSLVYASAWLPRELYFGPGLDSRLSGESDYAERTQSVRLGLSWGWQGFDSTRARRTEPLMFRDRVRMRGPMHRTWVSVWAGPRMAAVSRGRDPDDPSFEVAHPAEASGSLNRRVEQFAYGVGLSHDGRRGLPRWSDGWRASIEAERFDKSLPALALRDAHSGARSFGRLTTHAETGASFGRDPRSLRLALTTVDQRLDATGGAFLIGDLQSLGGGAGLAGFESGRFRDLDLVLAELYYLFPLAKNAEVALRSQAGGVYPDLVHARLATFEHSFGAALRLRTESRMIGALGCDWSREQARVWFALGGIE